MTTLSPNPIDNPLEVSGDQCLAVRDGRLTMDGVDLRGIADEFGTPCFVVSERQLRANVQAYVTALENAWPEGPARVLVALKANPSLALRHVLNDEGAGCDTFGPSELEVALRSGIDPSLISVNGTAKDAALLRRAIQAGARITLDSEQELRLVEELARELGTRPVVRFRLRPFMQDRDEPSELSVSSTPIATYAQRFKPGFPTEQLLELGRRAVVGGLLDVRGLHIHSGRHTQEPAMRASLARACVRTLATLRDAWEGWLPRELDFGGGYPVPRDPAGRLVRGANRPRAPVPEVFVDALTAALREELLAHDIEPAGIAVEIEPGRGVYGNAGLHLTTVRHLKGQVKPIPFNWVEVDTTEHFLAGSVREFNRWPIVAVDHVDRRAELTADVVGMCCTMDRLIADANLPDVSVGDVLALLDTGCYEEADASNFNGMPRPGTVLIGINGVGWIKRPETVADVLAREEVPAWLA